ncbi:hypothetical protein MANES_12G049400v8 [Manihot esculenta]|nr:hypothetical protein MANES_12G049400v8 [Manihot esculenta]KAG8641984.1 hypothetical protein MANES_12G049400v8 [Manihot esculenta]KAG8641987.1 hypothetical protein MANES_12G049400v8 [Manihot esculenta]KAG8641989.1 hypothetical protein MANES_12G049400v8 [Manihot esculenta]KAG8641990.1 hypothetical protein MANES_12G049400v8 [Manihot esculenta]
MQNHEIEDSLYMQELARRIKDEDRASGSQMFQKVVAADQRRDEVQGVALERRGEVQGMAVERNVGYQSEEKEKVKNKNEDNRTINGQRNHFDARGLGKAFHQNFSSMDQERVEGIVKLGEKKDAEKQMEGKEKSKNKEINVKSDKHKGKDREKNRKSKDKDRDKEEKKEEKAKEMTESIKEKPKLKENVSKLKEGGKDSLDLQNVKSSGTFRLSNASPAAEVNLGKRKELEKNGYLHDNGTRPNKIPRQMSSSFPAVENLNAFEKCQTGILSSEKRGLANNHKVDAKEQKLNGLVIVQQPNIRSRKPSSVGITANENGEISSKPHPDVKYLSQILSIPEMEELPDANDQEWLFSSNNLQPKKPSSSSSGVDGTRQVWAQALWIESADISALPYVIPY